MGVEYKVAEVRTAADIEDAISSLGSEDGLVVSADQFLWTKAVSFLISLRVTAFPPSIRGPATSSKAA